jgi:AcrR family transcriptional regulator
VIADRAGVGKGTVYRYFGSKEELFWATTLEVFVRLERKLVEAMQRVHGTLDILRATGLAYAAFFDEHPDCLEVFIQDRAEFRGAAPDAHHEMHERFLAQFVRLVEDGIAAGEVRPVDARKTILGMGGMLYGIAVHSAFTIHNYSLVDQTEFALDTFLKGLRPEDSP